MGDSTIAHIATNERHPSVYKLWKLAREEGGSQEEIEDRYRQLLDKYGHRSEWSGKW